jgi:hypothetical protein
MIDISELEGRMFSEHTFNKLRVSKIRLYKAIQKTDANINELKEQFEKLVYDYTKNLIFNNLENLVFDMSQLDVTNIEEAHHLNILDFLTEKHF